jgi:hypothetical protein
MKWQISPVPGEIDLSMTVGVALPTGAVEITGRGVQPYLQFPWSWKLHDGWGLSGMFTEFLRPTDFTGKRISETTFVVEKKLAEKISLFTEPSEIWATRVQLLLEAARGLSTLPGNYRASGIALQSPGARPPRGW